MAIKVPTLSNSGTQAQALPGVRQQGGRSAAEFMDTTEMSMLDSASKAVNSMQRASMSLYAKEVADANRLRVQDATNQLIAYDQDAAFSETGWRNQKGAAVFSQQNSKPFTENILESRQKRVDEIVKNLGNDEQRQAFQEYVNQSGLQLRGHLMGHEAEQHRVYKRGVLVDGIDSQAKEMRLYYNDDAKFEAAFNNIDRYSRELGKLEVGSEELGASSAKKDISKALKEAIEASTTQGDLASATRIVQKFGKHMDTGEFLKATELINGVHELKKAQDIGQTVISELYPQMQPDDFEQMKIVTRQTESGNRRYTDNGQLVTSPKGAMGEMQVMPLTAKDPGYGVKPAQNDSPEELARVGDDFLAAMLHEYNGDKAKAWAAYNAGPGNLNKALKMAESTGKPWLEFLPAQTQAYVSKNIKAISEIKTRPMPTLLDAKQKALELAGPDASPTLQKYVVDIAEKNFKDQHDAIKQRQDELTANVINQVYQNGGKWTDIPSTVFEALPPEDKTRVIEFSNKISKGEDVHDPVEWARIITMPVNELAKMSPEQFVAQYRDKLDDSHLDKGLTMIKEAASHGDKDAHLEVISTQSRIKNAAISAGILPEVGKVEEKQAQKYRQFETIIDQRVREYESSLPNSRKASSEELQKIVDATVMDTVMDTGGFWGSEKKMPVVLLDDKALKTAYVTVGNEEITLSEIPASQRSVIIDKLQKRGMPATEQKIAELWVKANKPK